MPQRRSRWLPAAAAAALAIAWLWPAARSGGPAATAPASPTAVATPAPTTTAQGLSSATAAPVGPAVHVTADVPPGISPEQWAALQTQLSGRPDGLPELHRLAEYFAWTDALRRFREARRGDAAVTDLRPLAQTLDDGLAERLRRSEVTAAEARQIESAVLEAIEPDTSRRAERLERWSAAQLAPPAPVDPRQAEFERRQSLLVAAWSAQPSAARDPSALARELEALRRETFAPGSR